MFLSMQRDWKGLEELIAKAAHQLPADILVRLSVQAAAETGGAAAAVMGYRSAFKKLSIGTSPIDGALLALVRLGCHTHHMTWPLLMSDCIRISRRTSRMAS